MVVEDKGPSEQQRMRDATARSKLTLYDDNVSSLYAGEMSGLTNGYNPIRVKRPKLRKASVQSVL